MQYSKPFNREKRQSDEQRRRNTNLSLNLQIRRWFSHQFLFNHGANEDAVG